MKRRRFLQRIGVAASLPLMGNILSVRAAAAASKSKAGSHRLLSCNVRVDVPTDANTGDNWDKRKDMCADIIEAQKADLIGLQEAQNVHLAYLKKRMPKYDTYALSHSVTDFHPINGILFLRDRYELISAGGFWLSEAPHIAVSKSWDSANPRLANWVHLRERRTGREFRYWNTHLDHRGQKAREKGATLIVQSAEVLPADLPQILTGDMNARANNPAIENFKNGGWVDTYGAVHGPADPGFTAHAFKGREYPANNPDGTPRGRIDWIFSRGPVKAIAAAVIRDGRNGHYPSDHFFMSADVTL